MNKKDEFLHPALNNTVNKQVEELSKSMTDYRNFLQTELNNLKADTDSQLSKQLSEIKSSFKSKNKGNLFFKRNNRNK